MSSPERTAPRTTFVVLAVAAASFSLLQSLITPVLPTIQRDLGTSQSTVTWVLTAWLLAAAIATPLMGKVGDMTGKHRTLVVALGLIAVGDLLAALAPNVGVLIGARVLQGFGGAVFPLAFGIIRDEFPPERVSSAVGSMAAVIGVGGGLGIVLAGPIVSVLSWRWLFVIPMAVVTVTAIAAWFVIPPSPTRAPGRLNLRAATLLAGWLVALLLPLSKAPTWGWSSPSVLGLFLAAIVLAGTWVAVELHSPEPLIDMRLMARPAIWTTNLVALLFGASMFATYAFLPQFLQIPGGTGFGLGASITESGLIMLPMLVTMALAGFGSGPLTAFVSAKGQLVTGAALTTLSVLAIAGFHADRWEIALAGAVFGVGLGLAFSAMVNLVVQNVPSDQTGVASGMNTNLRTIGGAIGAAVFSTIVTSHLQPGGGPAESGYSIGFFTLAAVALGALAVAAIVPASGARARRTIPAVEPTEAALEPAA